MGLSRAPMNDAAHGMTLIDFIAVFGKLKLARERLCRSVLTQGRDEVVIGITALVSGFAIRSTANVSQNTARSGALVCRIGFLIEVFNRRGHASPAP